MKAKKAFNRLKKAQSLVSKVVERYAGAETPMRHLLKIAGGSLSRAQTLIQGNETARPTPKVGDRPGKEQSARSQPARRGLSDAARKKLSVAAKKRWAAAKREGARTLAG